MRAQDRGQRQPMAAHLGQDEVGLVPEGVLLHGVLAGDDHAGPGVALGRVLLTLHNRHVGGV